MKQRYRDGVAAVKSNQYSWDNEYVRFEPPLKALPLAADATSNGHAQICLIGDVMDNFQFYMGVVTALGYNWGVLGSMSFETHPQGVTMSVFQAYLDVYKMHPGTQAAHMIRQGGDMAVLCKDARHEYMLACARTRLMLAVEKQTPPNLHRLVMNILDRLEEVYAKIKDDAEFTVRFGEYDMRFMALYHDGLLLLDSKGGKPVACGPWALLMDW